MPPAPTSSSAIFRLVNVLPVPQAMISLPRSCSASPLRTSVERALLMRPQRSSARRDERPRACAQENCDQSIVASSR